VGGAVWVTARILEGGGTCDTCVLWAPCAWRVERVKRVRGLRRRVTTREKTLMIAGSSGGAWRRVTVILDLKFSGFVDLRP